MGKKADLEIRESLTELRKLLAKQKTLKSEKRLKALLLIKEGKLETRQKVADILMVHIRTLERWVNSYVTGGIDSLLENAPRNRTSKIITPAMHEALSKKVHDAHDPFLGYWDAKDWIKREYGVDVKYQRIREYLIQHFGTKPKVPRKSHYKKDAQAEEAFLKTP